MRSWVACVGSGIGVGVCLACAPTPPCMPRAPVLVVDGEAPLILTSVHAGTLDGDGCSAPLHKRRCDAALDARCESGPCLAGRPDTGARDLTFAVLDAATDCMGAPPTLVMVEVERNRVDVNRDRHDAGGARCALEDPRAGAVWDGFYAALDDAIAATRVKFGDATLVVDLHSYGITDAAPPPAVILGAGEPFGATLPRRVARDPSLLEIFGARGLAPTLRQALDARFPDVAIYPARHDEAIGTLYAGRHLAHHTAPLADVLQIEMSEQLRQDPRPVGQALGEALCRQLGAGATP